MNPMRFLKWLFRSKPKRRYRYERIRIVDSVPDVPAEGLNETLYVVGQTPKWVMLECPCGCRDRVDVNLMQSRRPAWAMSAQRGTISLWPSLWRPAGTCGSHFWLQDNEVLWVDEGFGRMPRPRWVPSGFQDPRPFG